METKGTRIGVVVRVRPLLSKELKANSLNNRIDINLAEKSITILSDQKQQKRFEFDEVFDEKTTQEHLYQKLKLDNLIKKVIEGYNATIFAYGPTGSGKTYTMEGYEHDKSMKPIIRDDGRLGLIPRIVKNLFDEIKKAPSHIEYTVYCTYVQIYKENIYDLLNPAQIKPPGLRLRWNQQEEFYVENLFMHPCYSANEVISHYNSGLKNRIISSHNANTSSSRSHSLLSLNIEAMDSETGSILTSKLQLVDLAGSEKVSQTGNEGAALKESIEINKALFTLRQVISTLASMRDGEASFVPYRDSKLTSLLKQSIGGNSYCLMIACIAPLDSFFEDNLSTLTYATKALCISNEPIRNIDPKTRVIKELRKEVKRLNSELLLANQQISMLTEIVNLDPKEQANKLKEVEKLPLKAENLVRIKMLRSNIESMPLSPTKLQSQTTYSKFSDAEFSDFTLTPEILSEKLYDSVKMIRELMNANKKLKDMVGDLNQQKRALEAENIQLQNENQDLQEKLEMFDSLVKKKPQDSKMNSEIWMLQKEREELIKRIEFLEKETRTQTTLPTNNKSEWGWKSKRTVLRGRKHPDTAKPFSLVVSDRNYEPRNSVGRVTPKSVYRPLSQDFQVDMSKQDAINTLSQILMKGMPY
ncbi:hypothetical protein SteCoe_8201 [Stentor coeruleus]|uniref:Kinesin-like protein n=1 Tax=Stentor coeruleus TaxID=5963 RepID=A0A1R2CKW2_9CILI|nr:hypothetical protein SteCoe_8201 [Stentor coeruleus]